MSEQSAVIRRIPTELNTLLDNFHALYKSKFCVNEEDDVSRIFTDKVFAHMQTATLFEKFTKGKMTITPKTKSKSRQLEIDWSFEG